MESSKDTSNADLAPCENHYNTKNIPVCTFWRDKKDLLISEDLSGLSKNQQKKLLKKKLFMETRLEKRKQERERKKIKRALKKEAGLPLPESRRSKKRKKLQYSELKVVIDLDFYDLMNDRDVRMVLKQVKACYSENRKHDHPLKLCVTSFDKEFKDLLFKIQPGYVNWDLQMENSSYLDVFEKEKIVYLTSDSKNILDTLDASKVYIIGGLVDHNQHKDLCYRQAEENGIAHAQLPIDQFVKLNSRKVLAINHVFEILLHYSETHNWKDAFFKVLPNRKGVTDLSDNGKTVNDKGDGENINDDIECGSDDDHEKLVDNCKYVSDNCDENILINNDDDKDVVNCKGYSDENNLASNDDNENIENFTGVSDLCD